VGPYAQPHRTVTPPPHWRSEKDKAFLGAMLKKTIPKLFESTPVGRLMELGGTLPLIKYADQQAIFLCCCIWPWLLHTGIHICSSTGHLHGLH